MFDNIAFGLKYRDVPKAEIAGRVRRALELVRLPRVEQRLPRQLSGGQQQRVAVARAIVIQPDLVLFDEPLSALDANLREEMRIELKRIQHALGITTIFVTHDQSEALSMADTVVLMRDGAIEQSGPPDRLYNHPQSEFTARFFGQINEIEGVVTASDGNSASIRTDMAVIEGVGGNHVVGQRVKLLLRSERARVVRDTGPGDPGSAIAGTVAEWDYLGMLVRYSIAVGDRRISVTQTIDGELFAAACLHPRSTRRLVPLRIGPDRIGACTPLGTPLVKLLPLVSLAFR